MEYIARRKLKGIASNLTVFLIMLLTPTALPAARSVSFNLSTNRTFSPNEKPVIHLYAHNVSELEFRVYRVQNPAKFLASLPDLHSFRSGSPWGPKERIDERTWLEKFHDWKHHLWFLIRRFFRGQFSAENRDLLRVKQANLARRSRIVGVAQFAQIPLLNDRQLVARWRQQMPPTYVSDSQELPIGPLSSGLYLVEATDGHYKAYTLLMVSRMALITRTTPGAVLAYCVDRVTGEPLAGVNVTMGFARREQASAMTGPDGLAQLAAVPGKPLEDSFWVVAMTGGEVAVTTPGSYALSPENSEDWASYVYTDRPVYRPGHTVHWKAILRLHVQNHLAPPAIRSVHVAISDEQDHSIFDRDMPVSAIGTVSGDVTLPLGAALGYYTIRLGRPPNVAIGEFHVEEYRKPEYQVRVSAAGTRVLQGESMRVLIDARYFFGEPVANARVTYRVYHARHYWWDIDQDSGDFSADSDGDSSLDGSDQQSEQTGRLDADGKLTVNVPTRFDPDPERGYDEDYTVEAAVTDEANREITGRGRFLATRGAFRIHVEPVSYAVRVGEQAFFKVSAVDYDNHPVQTKIHLQLVARRWSKGKMETTPGAATDVLTGADGRGQGNLPAVAAGSLEIQASATAPGERVVTDSSWLWVMGGGEADWGGSRDIQIVADKKTYTPGDTAHISILSDMDHFHALIVVSGNSTLFQKVIYSEGKALTFDLPITADAQPNVTVDVVFVRSGQLYQASKQIKAPPSQQQLQVEITPARSVFQPQQAAVYDVSIHDYAGRPVSSDFSFGVVDEAIYSIYPDSAGDIVKQLYPDRYVVSSVDSSLQYYFSGQAGIKSPMLAERRSRSAQQLAQVKPANDVAQPRVRKAFPDTAYWSPSGHTDAQGHARVTMTFPDSLTTWRATVRAITADSKAGSAVNRVIVRKNVIVRMGTPRFLRKGDELTVPVIVHNYLDRAAQVQLSLDIHGLDRLGGETRQVLVPSKGDGTALWRLKASQIGTAKLTAKALTKEESDALEIDFPVEAPGVPRTISAAGVIAQNDGRSSTAVDFPANTDTSAHRLHVEVTPSIAGSLVPALDYLATYPYGCTEQTMSSFLPGLIVADTLKQLTLSVANPGDLQAKIQAGIERLNDLQHDDGGWGWWKEDESRVFMTAYVVSGLGHARRAGYPKADARLDAGVRYLQQQLSQHPRMIPDLRAYVVYALGEADADHWKDSLDLLWSRRGDLSSEGLALTGLAMQRGSDGRVPQLAKMLESRARHAGTLAYWPSQYNPLLDFSGDNDAESTAFGLRFLSRADPQSQLLQPAAQWLVANRQNGYWWDSTEQTATALFGLVDYLAASHELQADFDVDVLLNGNPVGKRHFTAADAAAGAALDIDLPAERLGPQKNTVEVVKHGAGRAYWSVQGVYYSTERSVYQRGTLSLNLARDYFKLVPVQKDGQIVYRLDPLNGPLLPGDTVAVHLAVNGTPEKYLLLEDPIPAGAEFIQQEDSYNIVDRPGAWEYWYTRREFHDDRAAIFSTEFTGRRESFYLLKVVNPGSFIVSPAHVEPMYQPGIQATSDELHIEVNEPGLGVKP